MWESSLQLFACIFFCFVSFGQPRVNVKITDKNQAAVLKASAEHHIVFPYVVDSDSNFVSHNIHHRTKRSLETPEIHYHIPFANERLHLELKANEGLMISGLEIEWRSGKKRQVDRNCHFIGSVRNYTKSSVAISNCRGLAGLIRADPRREFFIEPVLGLDPSVHDGKHAHVIYRRSVTEKKNRTEPACGVTVEDIQEHEHFEEEHKKVDEGFHLRRRSKRSVSLMKHIEILLVADYSMTKYYSDRDLESYLSTIMNMLSLVFKHRSIGSAINVVLTRMIIIDTEHEYGLNVTNHARRSLNTFCRWVQKVNPRSDLDPQHADAAVLVTRKDICRNSYKSCETLGLSNMDGMCSRGSECSYNQDTGFTLVYTIAHELGHNLGALHDDDYSSCARLRKHIMASSLVVDPASEQLWSKCSKKAMKSFIYKGWGWCLNDQPAFDLQPKLPRRMLPGERFDADAQCKMYFGTNSTICSGTESSFCTTLWCVHRSGNCATKHVYGKEAGLPALDGTPCGKTKWCVNRKCEHKGKLKEPVDGNWGKWSGLSSCSRACGRGVRRRTRKCTSPRPENGGFYCVGVWKRHSICNAQACAEGSDDPVDIQCKKFRALSVNGKRYDWTAKQNYRNPCELRCIPVLPNGRSRIRKFIQAQDGTPCNHGTSNICIEGKCEHVGCDDKLYSSARKDRCGICRGDGSTCETKHQSFDQTDGDGYIEALVIPALSRNIVIQEVSGSPNYLALRSPSGDYYLNGNWYIQWSGDYDVAGTSGHYSRRHNREMFKTQGPITEDLHVLLLYQGKNTGLRVQYDVRKNATVKPRNFHWKYSPWTLCSVTCGRGTQNRDINCVDEENNVVDARYCKSSFTEYKKRRCRRGACPPTWWVGIWHECSKTCGHAIKYRAVLCTQGRSKIIDDKKCGGNRPAASTICKQPLCWVVHPWSNCSSSCGLGIQQRVVQCPETNSSHCDLSTKPITNRTCVGNTCAQWRKGPWEECSASCGNGTQIRRVSCEHLEESMCRGHEKPRSTQACPGIPCPVWRAGEWSECSVTCGDGMETRNVTCEQGHVNFTCNESDKPAMVQSCLQKRCSGWAVSEWSSCSASCGEGMRQRKVVCTFKTCTAAARPKHKEQCLIQDCPRWSVSKWSDCNVSCGEGTQYRNITCSDPIHPCPEDTKPPRIQQCLVSECSIWSFGNWSECSVSCGSGVQTRSIICHAATQEECEIDIPESERPCNARPCMMWETGNWSECSTSCGPGIQERSVRCPSSSCDLEDRPNATRPCSNPDCAVWVTGNWGSCAVSCGEGVQTRQVYCNDYDDASCNALEMPESTRDCFVSRCGAWIITRWGPCSAQCGLGYTTRNATCINRDTGNCTGKPNVVKICQEAPCSKWSAGQWSPCSVTCNRGIQRRIVSCHGGGCLASTKPLSIKQCMMPSCGQWLAGNWSDCSVSCGDGVQTRDITCSHDDPKECTDTRPVVKRFCNKQKCLHWSVGEWQTCSASCGNGTQRRNVTCIGMRNCPNASKPIEYRACNSGQCPKWMVGDWLQCSRSCGGGFQIRLVYCRRETDTSCEGQMKPISRRRCKPLPCPHWIVGHWSDCSKSCDVGIQGRNVKCNNSQFGKCPEQNKPSTRQKCAKVPCPHWIVGNWSECSKSCNGGTRTRSVSCNNSHIGACLDGTKPATNQRCATEPCPKWSESQWSKCSKSCDGGTQTRSVICKNNRVGRCLTSERPKSSRKCAEMACPSWSVGTWSECSKSCNGGNQTRTVTCDNKHVGNCLVTDKPESTRKCGDLPCPVWSVSAWSKCSKSCGGGNKTRTVTCKNNHLGKCESQTRPASMVSCGDVQCPQWAVGEWSPCSKSCNGGIQSRSVRCNNTHIGECLANDKPSTKQSCGRVPCPKWIVGRWGKCSKSCNGGLKIRLVWCGNARVGQCSSEDKPRRSKMCRKMACPSWLVGKWSQCSKSCNGGIQTRSISCKNIHVGPCDSESKPAQNQNCSEVPCPQWSVSSWSSCSKSCDGGIRTRAVTCENGHIGKCPGKERPSTNQKCNEVPCPEWSVSVWSKCSRSCDGGIQIRRVSCRNNYIGKCSGKSKPRASQKCSEVRCPSWSAGEWSKCSKSCGGGNQSRNVACLNNHVGECPVKDTPLTHQRCGELPCPHWTVDAWSECTKSCDGGIQIRTLHCNNSHVGECHAEERPSTNQSCGRRPCPKWIVAGWSKCSKSCGGGVKYRTVTCKNKHVGNCSETEKPPSMQSCRNVPCPEWSFSEWSKCSKSCNNGTQKRTVTCNNSHIGHCLATDKPANTKQCAEVPCPVWSVGEWSKCSKSCDGGIQTRVVRCDNKRVGDCLHNIKPVSRRKCSTVPCPQWAIGQWSFCSKSCNGGIRTRNVTCKNKHVGACLMKDQPAARENCAEVPCPQWIVSHWSPCSKSCDGGIKTRIVSCQNSHVGSCLLTDKPKETNRCGIEPCPKWITGVWSKCSQSCNGGLQTRMVTCQNSQVGKCLDEEKPVSKQKCSEVPCPYWSVSAWSKCSKSCDGGSKYRTVTCVNGNVGDCLPDKKPRTMHHCHRRPCPEWTTGRWSPCSTSCGGGVQTRIVTCSNSHVGKCLVKNKPDDKRSCSDVPCPKWSVGQWSKCSQSCDGGIQKRTVTCENRDTGECLLKEKPTNTKQCAEVPCPIWSVGQWSKCSQSCDTGIQRRTVTCENSHVGECIPAKKPRETQRCSDVPCPEWSITEWSRCSKSCNGGIKTRNVTCVNSHVGDCVAEDRPDSTRKCGDVPCPEWSITEWSKCSKSCNGGIKTRTVKCINSHVGECTTKDRPTANQKCTEVPCPVWTVGRWSECSKSCNGGIQTRSITCNNSHIGDCLARDKPERSKRCNEVPCPKWSVGEWLPCTKSCGGGVKTRTVSCENSHVGDCLLPDKPDETEQCGMLPCPEWSVGAWSKCSKSCNRGTQYRIVTCKNKHVGSCSEKDKPITNQNCSEVPCPFWFVGTWSKCSKSCNGGTQSRTVTCKNYHVGKCLDRSRPSTHQNCSEIPCPEWIVGEWSKCSKSCDGGTQTRTVICKDNHVGSCRKEGKPPSNQKCAEASCPKWIVGNWSECSKSCDSGERTRRVECSGGSTLLCEGSSPANLEVCNELACPVWIVSNWTKCKARRCPKGKQSRIVECSWENRRYCNRKTRPVARQRCVAECPEWKTGKWAECQGSCTKGISSRRVWCEGGDRKCKLKEKPLDRKPCQRSSCLVWQTGNWNVCPVSCGGGLRYRTVHCVNKGTSGLTQGCERKSRPTTYKACALNECPISQDDIKPRPRTQCRQALRDSNFCRLLLRPSLSELCLFRQWKRRCCRSCLKVNAQRRR